MKKEYILICLASILSILALYFGFSVIGSPNEQRGRKLDQDRVTRLQNLRYSIEEYYRVHGSLPKSLSDITGTSYSESNKKDPETGKFFEYDTSDAFSYKLCATFATDSQKTKDANNGPKPMIILPPSSNPSFEHPKGYKCFELEAQSLVPYSYDLTPTPTPIPIISSHFEDPNIDSVTTNASNITLSRFPYGLFSSDLHESGLINYAGEQVTLIITFKKPIMLNSVSNLFNGCVIKNTCSWSGHATTADGKTIKFATDIPIVDGVYSKQFIQITDKLLSVTMTSKRSNGDKYVHWKKIRFKYK